MRFKILSAVWMDPPSFGSFGGGGRSGRFTLGRDGNFGRSGRFGSAGNIGMFGRFNEKFGLFGSDNAGRRGSLRGLMRNWKSGTEILIARRTSERSRTISGHFGNWITGRSGMIIDMSLNFQYWELYRSLRQTPHCALVFVKMSRSGCQLSAIALMRT